MRLGALVAGLAAAMLAAMPAWAETRVLRSADTQPAGYPTVLAVENMGRLLRESSGGRYDIKVFHSRQLGEESDTVEMVRRGALDLIRVNLAPLTDTVPETRVLTFPFLFRGTGHLHAVLDGAIGRELLAAMEPYGLVGLAFYDSGARSLYTVDRPVRSLADLKGLQIRVQPSDIFVDTVQALGATAVTMPYGQVGTALETGLIDGAENNWPSYESSGHFRAAPHYTLTRHSMVPEVLAMSKTVWDAMPPSDRDLVRRAAAESVRYMRRLWQEREEKAEAAVRAAGVTVYEPADPQAFVRAVEPVYVKYADERSSALVARIRNTR